MNKYVIAVQAIQYVEAEDIDEAKQKALDMTIAFPEDLEATTYIRLD